MRPLAFLVGFASLLISVGVLAKDARTPKLIAALSGAESYKVRATAAVAMGRVGDISAVDALATTLRRDRHYAVRAAAASALGRLPTDASVRPLLDALDDEDPLVVREAERALLHLHRAELQAAFARELARPGANQRRAVVVALGDIARLRGAPAAPNLLLALSDDDKSVAKAARQALDRLSHERAVPLLIVGLADERTRTRAAAAVMLKRRADERAAAPLVNALVRNGETPAVRREVCAALQAHTTFIDTQTASATLTDGGDTDARLRAVAVLLCVGDRSEHDAAAALLFEDEDARVRGNVAQILVESGDPSARALVQKALDAEKDDRQKRRLQSLLRALP